MRSTKLFGRLCLVAVVLAALVRPAAAADRYYMVVFASQANPNVPRAAHTWATFIKASGAGPFFWDYQNVDSHTISWMPASLAIVPARLRPEPGKNFDMQTTLKWAQSMGGRVSAWGPSQIQKGLYDRALAQIRVLNSGAMAYKAIDWRYRGSGVVSCFHAVSDIDVDNGWLETNGAYGDAASDMVAHHLQRWIIEPKKTYPALLKKLGLAKVEIRSQGL
jgi:hypothetical protein